MVVGFSLITTPAVSSSVSDARSLQALVAESLFSAGTGHQTFGTSRCVGLRHHPAGRPKVAIYLIPGGALPEYHKWSGRKKDWRICYFLRPASGSVRAGDAFPPPERSHLHPGCMCDRHPRTFQSTPPIFLFWRNGAYFSVDQQEGF